MVVLLIAAILFLCVGWVLFLFLRPSGFEQERDTYSLIIQVLGGALVVAGLYLTWQRIKAAQSTAEAAQATASATLQGQITERFSRAIDQIGALKSDGKPNIEIRLGGIYALEHIAREKPEEYYWTVMEVLTAYIRENAPRSAREDEVQAPPPPDAQSGQETTPPRRPRADNQAILTVLIRREHSHEEETNSST